MVVSIASRHQHLQCIPMHLFQTEPYEHNVSRYFLHTEQIGNPTESQPQRIFQKCTSKSAQFDLPPLRDWSLSISTLPTNHPTLEAWYSSESRVEPEDQCHFHSAAGDSISRIVLVIPKHKTLGRHVRIQVDEMRAELWLKASIWKHPWDSFQLFYLRVSRDGGSPEML